MRSQEGSRQAMSTIVKALMVGALTGMVLMGGPGIIAADTTGQPKAVIQPATAEPSSSYAGSKSCRECHERFYGLWSSSFHGLAMQPYTNDLAANKLTPQEQPLVIGSTRYLADIAGSEGAVVESGPDGERRYRIEHVMGGKNVFYFLTTLDRGRLQTLPVAYDVRRKEWFDTALSGVRHFPGRQINEEPVDWKEWPYTFNTSCYGCHVSGLSTNYDAATDSYRTTWKEPGINCETCHGPSEEHNRIAAATPKGQPLTDPKIIRTKLFTPAQHNDSCNSCHSKAMPITAAYRTSECFFDHFDLVTFEDPDFYPDGRDLGENYTHTSWLLSPCAKSGRLHCLTCHTSSGRYRFRKAEDADKACLPCHESRVINRAAHTHHKADGPGSQCISCHMPTTEFARMRRTDHSMIPPSPAATLRFKSPNACNGCHGDKNAAWADKLVREWHSRDYQAPLLERAELVDAARNRDWSKLPAMLDYVADPGRNEVFAASLIRLMQNSSDRRMLPVLLKAITDPSPLVRGAAAGALTSTPTMEALQALVAATGDDYRLVRVRAAAALSAYSRVVLSGPATEQVEKATREYLDALMARPDSWSSHYNMGNYHLDHGAPDKALTEYSTALEHEPRAVPAMVSSSIAHARLGQAGKAEEDLQAALKVAPDNAPALYNLGLLEAEQNNLPAAEKHLKEAIRSDPQLADAAYNLCVITAEERPAEAVAWCRKAVEIRPYEAKLVYTLAFYQNRQKDVEGATSTLEGLIGRHPTFGDAYLLLGDIQEKAGRRQAAEEVYRKLLAVDGMPQRYRSTAEERLRYPTPSGEGEKPAVPPAS